MKTATAFMTTGAGLFSETARMAFDESKHPRGEGGEFGSAGATRAATAHTKDAGKKEDADYHSKGESLHRAAAEAHKSDADKEKGDKRAYHEVMSQAHTTAAEAHRQASEKQDAKEESKEDAEKRMDAEAEARVRDPAYQKRLAAKKKRDIEWQKTHEK